MKFKIDNCDYTIYATSENMKCFGCRQLGHAIRACSENGDQVPPQNTNEGQRSTDKNEDQLQLAIAEGSSVAIEKRDGSDNGGLSKEKLNDVVTESGKTNTVEECDAIMDANLAAVEGEEETDLVGDENVF